ncbi:hypothetical protein V1515DRAFT_616173 [Lipomyces mesembrius]
MNVYGEEASGTRSRTPVAVAVAVARARSLVTTAITAQSPTPKYRGRYRHEARLKFLRDNEPERRLDIRLSYENFEDLEKQAHVLYGDAKYPRVEYFASDSRVTIYTLPTALHSRSAVALQQANRDCILMVLVQHNKQRLIDYILRVGEFTEESLNDQGTGSTKAPDAGLVFDNGQRRTLTLIIEAGVSEGYRALKRDIELWLNVFRCPKCILFLLNENPRGFERSAFDEAMQQARNNHPFGPYRYGRHAWFGSLKKAFIEVFKRDAISGAIISNAHVSSEILCIEIIPLVINLIDDS